MARYIFSRPRALETFCSSVCRSVVSDNILSWTFNKSTRILDSSWKNQKGRERVKFSGINLSSWKILWNTFHKNFHIGGYCSSLRFCNDEHGLRLYTKAFHFIRFTRINISLFTEFYFVFKALLYWWKLLLENTVIVTWIFSHKNESQERRGRALQIDIPCRCTSLVIGCAKPNLGNTKG